MPFTYSVSQIISTPSVFLSLSFFLSHGEVVEHYPSCTEFRCAGCCAPPISSPFRLKDWSQLLEVVPGHGPHLSAISSSCPCGRQLLLLIPFSYFSSSHPQCHKQCQTWSVHSIIVRQINSYMFIFLLHNWNILYIYFFQLYHSETWKHDCSWWIDRIASTVFPTERKTINLLFVVCLTSLYYVPHIANISLLMCRKKLTFGHRVENSHVSHSQLKPQNLFKFKPIYTKLIQMTLYQSASHEVHWHRCRR